VTAILATHVYGIPCDVEAIAAIAAKHGLKVIYDAAHAFGVRYKGRSILAWGDASTLSFHATKLFHTVEGGATILHGEEDDRRLRLLRSFGHIGDEHFALGMNAKMSEVHAAMGMAVLPHVERLIAERAHITATYDQALKGTDITRPSSPEGTEDNHAYYPVVFRDGAARERVFQSLAAQGIHARRYFYPSLDTLPYITDAVPCPISRSMADRVLSLPLYPGLPEAEVARIAAIVRGAL
jgi:dTDP-4-amino-4,6-dideoxygalactose transaminase